MRTIILLIIFNFVYVSSSAQQDTDLVFKSELITIKKQSQPSVVQVKAELITDLAIENCEITD